MELAKSLQGLTDATFNSGAAQTKIDANGVTAPAYQVGTQTYIDSSGLNANDRKVTHVQAGALSADSTDAVNGSQLYTVQEAAQQAQTEARKHTTVSVGDNNLVLTPTAENETKGADYALKLNNKITLGTGNNQVVLDGSDTGNSSFGT